MQRCELGAALNVAGVSTAAVVLNSVTMSFCFYIELIKVALLLWRTQRK